MVAARLGPAALDVEFVTHARKQVQEARAQVEALVMNTQNGGGDMPEVVAVSEEELATREEAVKAQLELLVDVLVVEGGPLVALEAYWQERRRKRFTLSSLALASVMQQDLKAELKAVQEELREVRRAIGKCEAQLANLDCAARGPSSSLKARGSAVREAERFIDFTLLAALEGGTTYQLEPAERLDKVASLQPGDLVVQASRVADLTAAVPVWHRLGNGARAATWGALGLGAYMLTVRLLRDGSGGQDSGDGAAGAIGDSDGQHGGASGNPAPTQDTLQTTLQTAKDLAESGRAWALEHIVVPTRTMAEQMFLSSRSGRHRADEHALAVQDAKSSLRNMMKHHAEASGVVEAAEAAQLADSLDMTLVSRDYEAKIRAPLRNVVNGNLVELALIQGQFLKLQALDAMLQIDRLLVENRFNSQLVVLAPALIVVGALYNGCKALYYKLVDDSASRANRRAALCEATATLSTLVARLDQALGKGGAVQGLDAPAALADGTAAPGARSMCGEVAELEGALTQAASRIKSILHSGGGGQRGGGAGAAEWLLLEQVQGRSGLSIDARGRLCSQLLFLVCGGAAGA